MGSSAGGGLSLKYALAHPERVERLVLLGPVVNGIGFSQHFIQRERRNLLKHEDVERVLTPPALARLAALRVPTLLVIGTRDTGDMQAIADTLTATVPGIRCVTFEGAGHLTNMEQPAQFTSVIRAFLNH